MECHWANSSSCIEGEYGLRPPNSGKKPPSPPYIPHFFSLCFTLLLLCGKEANQKTLIVQEKQQGGSVLHITNAMTGRISPIYLGYS
jgi:hypothetical protein